MKKLRDAQRRVALLEQSATDPSRGRIPRDWRSADAVLLRREQTPTTYDGEALPGISIDWRAPSIDGRVYVMVTDEEIYLRSGHDNPHANHLYWLAPLTAEQHAAVKELLAKRGASIGVTCGRPGGSADDCSFHAPHAERTDGADHLPITAKNLAALLLGINRSLPKEVARLPIPAPADLEQRVLVSQMADELADWLRAH